VVVGANVVVVVGITQVVALTAVISFVKSLCGLELI
jgi:hypothetical protein